LMWRGTRGMRRKERVSARFSEDFLRGLRLAGDEQTSRQGTNFGQGQRYFVISLEIICESI